MPPWYRAISAGNDIGSWKAISEIGDSDKLGNMVSGEAIMVDTRNTYIQAGSRLVATVGVDNLLVVDSDDALLISDRECSQDVKTVVDQLKQASHASVEYHSQVQCDWVRCSPSTAAMTTRYVNSASGRIRKSPLPNRANCVISGCWSAVKAASVWIRKISIFSKIR